MKNHFFESKQLDSKKKSREKYYDIEKWSQENLHGKLESIQLKFSNIKNSVEQHYEEALKLKESNEIGALDSLNKALLMTDKTVDSIKNTELKLDTELKPTLDLLRERLQNSKENFENSDNLLRNYLDNVASNLSDAMNAVANMNQVVCGELTSDSERCTAKCGGAVCDGKCGSNSSSCPGLADSYNTLKNLKTNFEDLYSKQETNLKKILTKVKLIKILNLI